LSFGLNRRTATKRVKKINDEPKERTEMDKLDDWTKVDGNRHGSIEGNTLCRPFRTPVSLLVTQAYDLGECGLFQLKKKKLFFLVSLSPNFLAI